MHFLVQSQASADISRGLLLFKGSGPIGAGYCETVTERIQAEFRRLAHPLSAAVAVCQQLAFDIKRRAREVWDAVEGLNIAMGYVGTKAVDAIDIGELDLVGHTREIQQGFIFLSATRMSANRQITLLKRLMHELNIERNAARVEGHNILDKLRGRLQNQLDENDLLITSLDCVKSRLDAISQAVCARSFICFLGVQSLTV